jgi:8-hydroxy-5-deazaflavin:NADPH oxidoreductase
MKIGILGSGIVGQTLALGFEKYGYDVLIGSRSPGKLNQWKNDGGFKGALGTFSDAAGFGEILVLAVKGSAAEEALRLSGKENHMDKIVIDTTNPIDDAPPVNGVLQFFTAQNNSLMELLQKSFPHLRLVKAFNCIGSVHMVNPVFSEGKPSMFICGNDKNAKSEVTGILDKFGFITEDMGNAEAARAIEPLCILWCIPGLRENQWGHAFKLIKK